jgi:5-methylcytosine-specific restriction enzyme A
MANTTCRKKIESLKQSINKLDTRVGSSISVQRIRGWQLTKIRERIALKAEYMCQTCGRVTVQGQVDHITPLHFGGSNSDFNLQWLCESCHKEKSDQEERERR